MTKYLRLGGSNNRHVFLTVLEAGNPRSEDQQDWSFLRPLSLACRWLFSPMISYGIPSVSVCVLISSPYRTPDILN